MPQGTCAADLYRHPQLDADIEAVKEIYSENAVAVRWVSLLLTTLYTQLTHPWTPTFAIQGMPGHDIPRAPVNGIPRHPDVPSLGHLTVALWGHLSVASLGTQVWHSWGTQLCHPQGT